MNNNAKKWVQALRSGEYKQGQGKLRPAEDRFCCLGVACDLHAKETGNSWEFTGGNSPTYLGEWLALPEPVVDWFGLGIYGDRYKLGDVTAHLADQNDDGVPFERIAEIIESEPKGLFSESER